MKNKIILIISCLFLTLPLYIFLLGYLNLFIGIFSSIVLSICIYNLIKNEEININYRINKKSIFIFILCFILISLWVYFSGIGSFSYQNKDFNVRNAVFRDLINYKWPIIFNFRSRVSDIVKYDSVGFVYYFNYFLPSSLIGKIFNIQIANVFLYLYSVLILCLVVFLIKNKFNKNMLFITIFFILFSGLDVLCGLDLMFKFNHLEWWNRFMQYTSNTTQVYWVFNQSIMIWLICILLLYFKKMSSIIFVSSLSFLYSPFATIGMIPIVIALILKNKPKESKLLNYIKNNMCIFEIINCLILLVIYGSFYLSAESSISINYFLFKNNFILFIPLYIIFISIEFGCYLIFIYKKYKHDILFIVVVLELLLIPLYKMTPSNDFCMRVSIGPLFILMIYIIDYLINSKNRTNNFWILILFIIGSFTGFHEIGRSIYNTFKYDPSTYLKDDKIYSIGNPKTKRGIELCNEQFYSKNYNKKFFFKYLVKKGNS